jgi:hypothetical protein
VSGITHAEKYARSGAPKEWQRRAARFEGFGKSYFA